MTMTTKTMKELWQDSYLASGSEGYLETLYETYLTHPAEVPAEWCHYFDGLSERIHRSEPDIPHMVIRQQFLALAQKSSKTETIQGIDSYHDEQQERVTELILAYRRLGHLQADIDPLKLYKGVYSPVLELGYYGFTDNDLKKSFSVGSFTALNKA